MYRTIRGHRESEGRGGGGGAQVNRKMNGSANKHKCMGERCRSGSYRWWRCETGGTRCPWICTTNMFSRPRSLRAAGVGTEHRTVWPWCVCALCSWIYDTKDGSGANSATDGGSLPACSPCLPRLCLGIVPWSRIWSLGNRWGKMLQQLHSQHPASSGCGGPADSQSGSSTAGGAFQSKSP